MSKVIVSARGLLTVAGGVAILCLLAISLTHGNAPSLLVSKTSRSPGHHDDGSLSNVRNATLGFQKIFVINLPSRTDHRDSTSLAAHLTGLQIDYVAGATSVEEKTLPPHPEHIKGVGMLGSWRAHMNVLRIIVEQNITSALILEDDTDWDLRIKSQMEDFARASRLLVQPLQGSSDKYLDPTYWSTEGALSAQDFDVAKESTALPTTSPYGDIDRWDLFWLGHCGAKFPKSSDEAIPLGRAVIFDDVTVPEHQHIDSQYGDSQLVQGYPHHTRVVTRARMNTCTLAYAVSLPGARRYLYELALRKMDRAVDIMIRDMCDGTADRPRQMCLSVQPQLFQHHRPIAAVGSFSDIGKGEATGEYTKIAFSRNIRWSTKVNFPQLVYGDTNYTDLFRDGEPRPQLGYR